MREIHEKEINDLKLKLEKLKLNEFTDTVLSTIPPEKNSDSNLESNNHSSLLGMSLLEREECEVNLKLNLILILKYNHKE